MFLIKDKYSSILIKCFTKKFILFCLLFFPLFGCEATREDWLIIPNKQVGKIHQNSSEIQLIKIYGKNNATDGQFYIGEGFCEPGTILFSDNDEKRLEILWGDKENKAYPTDIQLFGKKSYWHTKEKISLGTNVKELTKINKSNFKFIGFDWDYGGYISSWKEGHIESEKILENISLRLNIVNDSKEYESLNISGDEQFDSAVLKPVENDIEVDRIIYQFQQNRNHLSNNVDYQKPCEEL